MKQKRFHPTITAAILVVLVASFTLYGCATLKEGKESEAIAESAQDVEAQLPAPDQASTSKTEESNASALAAGASQNPSRAQVAGRERGDNRSSELAATVIQALEGILPDSFPSINWNRVLTIAVGIIIFASFYGLAIRIGRRPARRRAAGHKQV